RCGGDRWRRTPRSTSARTAATATSCSASRTRLRLPSSSSSAAQGVTSRNVLNRTVTWALAADEYAEDSDSIVSLALPVQKLHFRVFVEHAVRNFSHGAGRPG